MRFSIEHADTWFEVREFDLEVELEVPLGAVDAAVVTAVVQR